MMQLKDRVALVTGAGSGIGKAAAVLLGKEGAKVGLLGRTEEDLLKTAREMNTGEKQGVPLVADISKPEEMQSSIEKLVQKWGRLDIVFANAGINGVWAPLDELSPEDWDQTLDVNLKGTFLTLKYSLPHLKKRGGSVIITSSVNGTRMFSNTGATAYACSKAAQVAFTKMTALELAQFRIRVNVICPGAISTEIDENTEQRQLEKVREPVDFPEGKVPLTDGKPGTSQQVAQLVLFLASDASNHITGTEMWIDGGQSLLQG
jgi:NAD(P)-dependent dehydrogenase (short-subunit alcohol dehydrogenase family)